MSASVRLVVLDLDGNTPEVEYVIDNLDTFEEAVGVADEIAAHEYGRTGVVPRFRDGTPYWGESDENTTLSERSRSDRLKGGQPV